MQSPNINDPSTCLLIDAGTETVRCSLRQANLPDKTWSFSTNRGINNQTLGEVPIGVPILLSGKLSSIVKKHLGRGHTFSPMAVLWSAAARLANDRSVAILDLSASGYILVGIGPDGQLKDDLLITNPRCGAGSGINLDRVLRKLAIQRSQVDDLLADFLGEEGSSARQKIPVRADRCGVFASSATISDKNQGIPIDFALASTLKSEVLKACKHLQTKFDRIILTGGMFRWQFARDCATDHIRTLGIKEVTYDDAQEVMFHGLSHLARAQKVTVENDVATLPEESFSLSYPSFSALQKQLESQNKYKRLANDAAGTAELRNFVQQPLLIGIDVGSTMAKVVISDATNQEILHRAAYSNAGDTIETIKAIFRDLTELGSTELKIERVGVTGSARYQVQRALTAVYPALADRVTTLVENYAHARGSVDLAREHLKDLERQGVQGLNTELCLLVDVGGEDTKISSIDLRHGDLYDNAMNTKCSAGTGSLLDTLVDLFALDDIATAVRQAMDAPGALTLNATCAVFLLEHARRLQAVGRRQDEILASAVWAIVENMARSLWTQIHMPNHTLVLLHGQTMKSDPLPLAITQRLQSFLGGPAYCLVPPDPGHRACLGLIRTLTEQPRTEAIPVQLDIFINAPFTRRITQCKGAVCGDHEASCYRSMLTTEDALGKRFSLHLGGCAAINELPHTKQRPEQPTPDTCQALWRLQQQMLPTSDRKDRLVIPRSFAVSEWARFFASLFEPCGVPVHVDTPTEQDVLRGQTHFRVDTCAPHIGVVGQFMRIAEQPHGIILAPQIDFLPVQGGSLGRTCTINQGGFAAAKGLAETAFPEGNILLFHINMKTGLDLLAHKLYERLLPAYRRYAIDMPFERFQALVESALAEQRRFRVQVADHATGLARQALAAGQGIALVVGREYILNPGVYDSHIGRLLRDKGLVAIPSYVLNIECDARFAHLYWRNAHMIATLADAVAKKRLHNIVGHQGLKEIIRTYEQGDSLLPLIQVSTFLCGPDSVTNPLVNALVKNRPFLRIQSDAAIKELAHLENRMNTYVRQLASERHQRITLAGADHFDVKLLDLFVNQESLNPEHDVICFPTLSDNRGLIAVLRSAGFCCLENYTSDYSLQALIEQGRQIAGDSVCAPLAAVYGDIQKAILLFQRGRADDPALRGKKRLLIFNNKGLGPCRQGQYVEAHKLFLQQAYMHTEHGQQNPGPDEQLMQFLVARENEGFNTGFPGWVFLRGIQSVILQGVLHQLLAEGSTRCRTDDEYRNFLDDYRDLKTRLYCLIEATSKPGERAQRWCQRTRKIPGLYHLIAFFAWGFHRTPQAAELSAFRKRWLNIPVAETAIRIHIDGEAYMRTAQFEDLHSELVHILGPGRFHLTYTPLWGFLEYKLAGMQMRAKEGIAESRAEISRGEAKGFILKRKKFLRTKQKRYLVVSGTAFFLRKVLAGPLYRAVGISLPEALPKVLEFAKRVIPTRRPGGELIPYIGEAAIKLTKGYDLILNVAPEGCMVSSMGEVITPAIYAAFPEGKGKIQPLFSQQGDVNSEELQQALLQALGPERVCRI